MKYADAGVNIAVADDAKQRIRHLASRTFTPAVLGGIGGFGALYSLDHKKFKEPVLVSSADGVGTKLKIAMAMGVHSTVGGDLVNHCVNDILVQGAEPLFFLDYLAMGKLEPDVIEQLVDGMSRACRKAGCALIGGETAEMPGFYPVGEYDLAGFIVGIVERKNILTGKNVTPGDTLLALPSAGLHTNGSSLPRIACGGIPGNLPRVLPSGVKAIIDLDAWPIPSIFKYLAKLGEIDTDELLQSFNMGVGMVVIVPSDHVKEAEADLKRRREKFFRIGRIERGDTGKARLVYSGALNL